VARVLPEATPTHMLEREILPNADLDDGTLVYR
jgi:hypothetical protein